MDLLLEPSDSYHTASIPISGSKSESNRLLILQALFPNLTIKNGSIADDTVHLAAALQHTKGTIDIGHAGTAMRFLTAYYACTPGANVTITGSDRMKQRPIKILVDALVDLGASIQYVDKQGYPPLCIQGKSLTHNHVVIDASVSSQYISALLLIAPSLKNGLEVVLKGTITSQPYIEMTLSLLQQIGVSYNRSTRHQKTTIQVSPLDTMSKKEILVESDWSSASYWYSWVALQDDGYEMFLNSFKKNSIQGDQRLIEIYQSLGVSTHFTTTGIRLVKTQKSFPNQLELDLTDCPDLAQSVFATALGLGVSLQLTGLHTLTIKETDRIEAMRVVGSRFGNSQITTTSSTIKLVPDIEHTTKKPVVIDTFNDHRMAMAFAPLSCNIPLIIKDASVVTKSYVHYWKDLKKVNVQITEI